MGAFGGPNIVEDGLVFSADAGNKQCYISGSASPDIIIDSIKGAQGTVDNTITYNPANGGYWVFDGSDSDIALGAQTAGQWSSDPCTFEFWARYNTNNKLLYMDRTSWNGTEGVEFFVYSNNKFYARASGNGSTAPAAISSALSSGVWYQLVGVFNGTDGKAYVNGVEDGTETIIPVNDSTGNSYIGVYGDGSTSEWDGDIAIVRIYHKALTAEEVQQNYISTKDRFGL